MHFCGEQRLAHWYTAFSANAPEPVLGQIFKVLAADELRHGAAYAKYLRKAVQNKPEVLPAVLRMALWMIRTTNDNPKHPTTITEPSVVSLLEDPHYIRRMLNAYLPGRDHEAPVQRRILALMSELAGTKIVDDPRAARPDPACWRGRRPRLSPSGRPSRPAPSWLGFWIIGGWRTTIRIHATVRGRVQMVGFRAFVLDRAWDLEVRGTVANRPDGSVECVGRGAARAGGEIDSITP